MISDIEFEKMMLKQKQSLLLDQKINIAERRIEQFYEHFNGQVYVAFSGGKDSTVLLDLVRKLYPNVPAVFVNTGLEYPEIVQFVKTIPNVITLKPKMNFKEVLDTYGYPVISKLISRQIHDLKNPTEKNKATRILYETGCTITGEKKECFKVPEKWLFLKNAPFKISEKCCNIMKKNPIHKFEKETGLQPYVGIMANDSRQRQLNYCRTKCNSFGTNAVSRPLSIWLEKDIWEYINKFNIPYSKIYDVGLERTGCMFCLLGMHLEKNNRFDIMRKIHPQLYKYCMETLKLRDVINFINIKSQYQLTFEEKL